MAYFEKKIAWVMARKDLVATALGVFFSFLSAAALASPAPISTGIPVLSNAAGATALLCNIMSAMFWTLLAVSIIMILWAAFLYITANGDEKKVTDAKMSILYAAIGIVVGLLAKGFPAIITSMFPGAKVGFCYSAPSTFTPM